MTTAVATATPAPKHRGVFTRARDWIANPWGRPRFLIVFTWAYMLWSIVPVLIAVQYSFNDSRSRTIWAGFSTRWYISDPNSVINSPGLSSALVQSLKLAAADVLIATPIGVLLALGLARWTGHGSGTSNFIMLFPLVTPEIVMGVSLLLVFSNLFTFIHTGTLAQILGHVTFSISYVVVIVRGRLFSIGRQYEEAAADLGASPRVALFKVLLPLLTPAIVAGAAIVFAISIDDFAKIDLRVARIANAELGGNHKIQCGGIRRRRAQCALGQRERDRRIESRAGLAQERRREVGGDPPLGKLEVRVVDGRADPIP